MILSKSAFYGFIGLAVFLIASNLFLYQQNRRATALERSCQLNLQVVKGEKLPSLTGRGISGNVVSVDYGPDQPATLLFVFAPTCNACTLNWPNWRSVLRTVHDQALRIVAVSMEESVPSDYLAKVGLGQSQLVATPTTDSMLAYRLRFTPQTIAIASDGRVVGVWTGVLTASDVRQLESTIASFQHVHNPE